MNTSFKRFSHFAQVAFFALLCASCEPVGMSTDTQSEGRNEVVKDTITPPNNPMNEKPTGVDTLQNLQYVKCNPSLIWLREFFPYNDVPQGMPQKASSIQHDSPHPDIAFFARYENADFLRITVSAGNHIDFLHHSIYPCSARINQQVVLMDKQIILWETEHQPATTSSCTCDANITSSISVPHLDYHTLVLSDYDMELPIYLYEGMDTLIMIHTDIPFAPTKILSVGGYVRDDKRNYYSSVPVVLSNTTGEIADTVYTNEGGRYDANYEFLGCEDDTLTITVTIPEISFLYDTCKTVHIAFSDMAYEIDRDVSYYYCSQYFNFAKDDVSVNPLP
jgi:hypothetical protein